MRQLAEKDHAQKAYVGVPMELPSPVAVAAPGRFEAVGHTAIFLLFVALLYNVWQGFHATPTYDMRQFTDAKPGIAMHGNR